MYSDGIGKDMIDDVIKIKLRDYSYYCDDGCCSEYGTVTTVNGVELPSRNTDPETILRQVLEHLGYKVVVEDEHLNTCGPCKVEINMPAPINTTTDKRTFESGAVRDSNEGKPRPDLISPYFTERLGYRMLYGIQQGYPEHNWKGIPSAAHLESLERHLIAYKMGKKDEDHSAAIAFNIMGIIHNEEMDKLNDLP